MSVYFGSMQVDTKAYAHQLIESKTRFQILVLDIRGLSIINYGYGERIGDGVLAGVSEVIESICGEETAWGRAEDDDFIVFLTHNHEAWISANMLRFALLNTQFRVSPTECVRISLSSGYALYPEDGQSLPTLKLAADKQGMLSRCEPEPLPEFIRDDD